MTQPTTRTSASSTGWKLGQYVCIWRNGGYEYGHIELLGEGLNGDEVMLVGDDGREIYCYVKDLETAAHD